MLGIDSQKRRSEWSSLSLLGRCVLGDDCWTNVLGNIGEAECLVLIREAEK